MKEPKPGRAPSGFTLIEMLAVLAIMIILMLFAVPVLQTTMRQSKLRAIVSETATLMRQARLEAIRRSCTSIVRIVEEPPQVEGFSDCDKNGVADADKPALGSYPLPTGVSFLAPPDLAGEDSVAGFSLDPNFDPGPNVAIFQPDGSIDESGGFRFADDRGNFLEVWVEPKATARVEIHKCRLCTDADNRADWYAAGAGGEAWTWN
jgi:prepilin-type N-terminal cleavage/methylation domain-containing protein